MSTTREIGIDMLQAVLNWIKNLSTDSTSLSQWREVHQQDLDYLRSNETISQAEYDRLMKEAESAG